MKFKTVFIVCILAALFLCGCKGKKDNLNGGWETVEEEKETSWNVEHSKLGGKFDTVAIAGERIIGCSIENGEAVITFQNMNSSDDYAKAVLGKAMTIDSITADEEGNAYVLGFDGEKSTLWTVDTELRVQAIDNIEMENIGAFPSIRGLYKVKNLYYVWCQMDIPCKEVYEDGEEGVYTTDDRIYVKDSNMKTLYYDDIPSSYGNQMICFTFDVENNPIFLAQDEEGYYMRKLKNSVSDKPEKERIKGKPELIDSSTGSCNNICLSYDGLMYTKNGDIFKYSLTDGTSEKMFHLAGAGIDEDDILSWCIKDGEIRIVDNYRNGNKSELTTIKEGSSKKTTIKIAVAGLTEDKRNIISSFNRSQNSIQLYPIEYVDDYDYDSGIDSLQKDILRGEAPDLFFTTGLDYEVFVHAGVFENLYKYLDSDPELGRKEIVPSVLASNEIDDKLYAISPGFNVFTMWGGESTTQGKKGVNMEEVISLLKKAGGNINCIYGLQSSDESILRTLTSMELDRFINWDECTCDFKRDEFYKLLELSKKYEGCNITESISSSMQNRNILMTCGILSSVEDYCIQKQLYGEKIDIIGYPTDDGFGAAMSLIDSVAMNSKSNNKSAAWEFIKYYVKNKDEDKWSFFPTYLNNYEEMLEESMQEDYMVNEDGESERIAKATYKDKDCDTIFVFKAEQADVDAIRDLINSTNKKHEYVTDVQNIIEEEAGAYLGGQKSAEDVSDIIQSRIEVLLQERRE